MVSKWKKNPHNKKVTLDLIHIVICIAIVVLAGVGFSDVSENYFLFPVVFALAAVLDFINGVIRCRRVRGEDRQFVPGVLLCTAGALLVILAVVSAYVTWRQMTGI